MQFTYCRGWHRFKRKPVGPLSDQEAAQLHRLGKPYVAVSSNAGRAEAFLEINGEFFGVSFLDSDLREYLTYAFRRVAPRTLFLTRAVWREFSGRGEAVSSATIYHFKPSGDVSIEQTVSMPHVQVSSTRADVAANYEREPEFGSYEGLLVKERHTAGLPAGGRNSRD
jgi:hypothetical protein